MTSGWQRHALRICLLGMALGAIAYAVYLAAGVLP